MGKHYQQVLLLICSLHLKARTKNAANVFLVRKKNKEEKKKDSNSQIIQYKNRTKQRIKPNKNNKREYKPTYYYFKD